MNGMSVTAQMGDTAAMARMPFIVEDADLKGVTVIAQMAVR